MKQLMDVFSLYEEEQVLPKPNVLRYAAKVLETAGEPVPFKVPLVCFRFTVCHFSYLTLLLSVLFQPYQNLKLH